jgi:localization factor PodJL
MANAELNQRISHEIEAMRADTAREQAPSCQAGDLRSLLHSIVDQISQADRRHSDTLREMQDKLGAMGRDAQSIRSRVPGKYSAAFERIEAGMAELASRIADVSEATSQGGFETSAHQPEMFHSARPASAAQTATHEPPMALRSAADASGARRTEEDQHRPRQHAVDTFDVIESSLPGNAGSPWDHESAAALANIYDSGEVSFAPKAADIESFAPVSPAAMARPVTPSAPPIEQSWLEARFADISKRIEDSLADINHDHAFFAMGQRLDQIEAQLSNAFEGVATRGDLEGVRLIEAHMTELVGHLESSVQQMARLETIEQQLANIAGRLEDVHALASEPAPMHAAPAAFPAIDVHEIARAAAHEAALRFATVEPTPARGVDEIRGLIEQLMMQSRQGEENTSALLDTLQQAMIRLLDRVDAL